MNKKQTSIYLSNYSNLTLRTLTIRVLAIFLTFPGILKAARSRNLSDLKKINADAGKDENTDIEKKIVAPGSIYTILQGDSLTSIALAHGISVLELSRVNGIEDPDKINHGEKLILPVEDDNKMNEKINKRGVLIEIPEGFALSRIARAYKISLKKIIRANRIKNPDRIRAGKKIIIPGAKKIVKLVLPPPCYNSPVTLFRVRNSETHKIPLTYCSGKPNPTAIKILSDMSGPVNMKAPFMLDKTIIIMLQRVADKYPGRRIEIISGQRISALPGHTSYHTEGKALDYRVERVSNLELVKFIRKFKNVGAGYYPNSVFIHMDARKGRGYWIDYSRPGEKSIYGKKGMTNKELEKIREKRIQLAAK